ncbi:hypothetical protein M422DRAFT_52241 [Sphaerobolus stellatus SS14]|uniref:Uncharacterized protein n=1 Tax=Sphaerobolus stellatus (strain SS14) TaxID=990650 RepID=A0A0C9V924_SPHS4|nr:hypothetical protein M422DRAFT_52241 [Sphaerobolus stellatus SS14]
MEVVVECLGPDHKRGPPDVSSLELVCELGYFLLSIYLSACSSYSSLYFHSGYFVTPLTTTAAQTQNATAGVDDRDPGYEGKTAIEILGGSTGYLISLTFSASLWGISVAQGMKYYRNKFVDPK